MNRVALTISLLLIWFTPITLFILDQIPKNLFDIEKKIGYEISRGAIYLLAIQYAVLSIAILGYHIISFDRIQGSTLLVKLCTAVIVLAYLLMNYLIIKGFLFTKNHSQEDIKVPKFETQNLSAEANCIYEATQSYSEIVSLHHMQMEDLRELSIPVPQEPSETNKTPFVDYLKELSDMPKSHASLASLEQFALAIADKSGLYDFGDKIIDNLQGLAKDGVDYVVDLKDILLGSKESFADYLSHHDQETTHTLLDNIKHCIYSDFHGAKFRFDL